jgi:hypothetical protein
MKFKMIVTVVVKSFRDTSKALIDWEKEQYFFNWEVNESYYAKQLALSDALFAMAQIWNLIWRASILTDIGSVELS